MLLRTRITLLVFLVSLALIVTLVLEGNWSTRLAQDEMDQARIQGQKSAWTALVHNALQPLDLLARSAARNGTLTGALAAEDLPALATVAKILQSDGGSRLAAATVEISTADGRQVFGGDAGEAILTKSVVAAAGRKAGPIGGLFYANSGMPVLAVVAPLYSRSGFVGAIGVTITPQLTVKELAASVGADAALSDRSGGFPALSKGGIPLDKVVATGELEDGVFSLIDGGRHVQATRTVVAAAVEGPHALLHSVKDVTETSRRSFWLAAISLGGVISGAALSLAFLHWSLRGSFRPLYEIIHLLDALARGERPTRSIATSSSDEIGRLAATATDFRKGLDARDQLLKLRQDIDVAHNIQQSILPDTPPDRPEFVVNTYMHPARDVGGDFFDYFDLPDGRFGFVIADVSGKGMGAALFMAVACTVIRSTARLVADPGECLSRVNDLLAANNAHSMFVTAFYGVYSPQSGKIVYANGGHNPPYKIGIDGRIESLPKTNGKLLALFPGRDYSTAELTLAPGESVFLYTDGITEAQDGTGALFGDDRLKDALTQVAQEGTPVLSVVLARVNEFVGDAPQVDDITCLGLQRRVAAVV